MWTEIKSLVLSSDKDGNDVIVDLLKNGDQTKANAINQVGKNGELQTLPIPTVAVDLQTMYLVVKTINGTIASSAITETLKYTIGASNSIMGSYLSITNNKLYTLDGAKYIAVEVVAVSSEDGNSVVALKKASAATSADVVAKAGKVAFFQDGASAEQIKEEGVVITESGAICKIVSFTNTSYGDATFEGITMKSGLGAIKKVDVSAFTFSK